MLHLLIYFLKSWNACCQKKSLLSLSIFLKLPFSVIPRKQTTKFQNSHSIQLSVMFTATITDICYLIQSLRFVSMPSQFCVPVYVMKLFVTCLG